VDGIKGHDLRKEFFHLPPWASSNPFQGAAYLFLQVRDFHFGASILRGKFSNVPVSIRFSDLQGIIS
jgi:hypothetical protein